MGSFHCWWHDCHDWTFTAARPYQKRCWKPDWAIIVLAGVVRKHWNWVSMFIATPPLPTLVTYTHYRLAPTILPINSKHQMFKDGEREWPSGAGILSADIRLVNKQFIDQWKHNTRIPNVVKVRKRVKQCYQSHLQCMFLIGLAHRWVEDPPRWLCSIQVRLDKTLSKPICTVDLTSALFSTVGWLSRGTGTYPVGTVNADGTVPSVRADSGMMRTSVFSAVVRSVRYAGSSRCVYDSLSVSIVGCESDNMRSRLLG